MSITRKILEKLHKDNKGSAIVMVIIALAFIGVLGITIMWMSLSNYRMKVTDQRNKQGFYTAETVFEQIKVGLQKDASEAANTAYSIIMQKYDNKSDSDWSEVKREDEFKREFKRCLIKLVSEDNSGTSSVFKISHLAQYIDSSIGISTDPSSKGDPIRFLGADTGTLSGDIEGAASVPGSGETSYIILKGIMLEYTDDEGFYSEINTDIMIEAPSTSFISSAELPPVFDYAMLADEGIEVNTGELTVDGGIYAGSGGIRSNQRLLIANADKVVAKGPVDVGFNGEMTVSSNILYAGDISVYQGNLKTRTGTSTRVANDLSLTGRQAKVTFNGEYYGFGNDADNSEKSSAILINGLASEVNLSNLDKLVLAGRSFIGTSTAKEQANGADPGDGTLSNGMTTDEFNKSQKNIKMGESLAVKGNQLAYLVPAECMCRDSRLVKGKNPMTWSELSDRYLELTGPATMLDLVDYQTTAISWLNGKTLSDYMPGVGDKSNYVRQVFAPSNGEILVFFYIILDDSKAAEYSHLYYIANKDRMDGYVNAYSNSITLPNENKTWSAAALISNNGSVSHNSVRNLTPEEVNNCGWYGDLFKGYCYDLSGRTLTTTEESSLSSNVVYEHTINITDLDDFLTANGGHGTNTVFEVPAGQPHEGLKAIIADTSSNETVNALIDGSAQPISEEVFVYDDTITDYDKIRVLITDKNVLLKKPFKGIIVTNGKIYAGGGATSVKGINKDPDLREEVMAVLSTKIDPAKVWAEDDPTSWRPIDMFIDGARWIGSSDSGSTSGKVDIASSVNFRNWVKK